jgi:outer membrane protein, heavy metal efflux system
MKRFFLLLLIARPLFAIDFQKPDELVAIAVEKHPALVRMRAEAAAARERIAPAESLPNPMLMSGVQNKQVNLRDDEMMTMYMVGMSQRLVRPEKREAAREAAELMARALEKELDAERATIEREVLMAWYDLAATDAQLSSAMRVKEMIEAIVAAARVRYEVGNAMQAEVIRAQLEASNLEHEILTLRGTRRAALARLLPLLELPLETDVPAVTIPENTDDLSIDEVITPPSDHPSILALEAEVAAAEAEIRMAEAERKPDLELEAQYGYRRLERDMITLVARVELPLRAKTTIEPRVREAILRRDAARARIGELHRTLTTALAEAVVAHEEATNQMKFHHEVLVPQAQLAFESTLAAYQTGSADFEAILTTETEYLRRNLEYYEFLAQHAQAVVRYESLRRGAKP